MTKDFVTAMLAKLKAELDQHIANANATRGAIQAYQHMLAEIEKEVDDARDDFEKAEDKVEAAVPKL